MIFASVNLKTSPLESHFSHILIIHITHIPHIPHHSKNHNTSPTMPYTTPISKRLKGYYHAQISSCTIASMLMDMRSLLLLKSYLSFNFYWKGSYVGCQNFLSCLLLNSCDFDLLQDMSCTFTCC